jgi:hypothetical protein
MNLADIRTFISQAASYSMPTAYLTRLVNEYEFDFEDGPGTDHVRDGWLLSHKLVLYEPTWRGLTRSDFADVVSVQTLYHEGTHAYIDLVDYDDSREFGEAMQYYEMSKLADGNYLFETDTERAVQEAAATYVGHRASTLWKTWWRVKFVAQLVKNVADGQMTVARAIELMKLTGKSTVRNDYEAAMRQQVFGYVSPDRFSDDQVQLTKPIYYKLSAYCDRMILENSIADSFDHMPQINMVLEGVYRAAQKFPELAKAMVTP